MATINAKEFTEFLFTHTDQNFIRLYKDMQPPIDQDFGYCLDESNVPDELDWCDKFMEIMNVDIKNKK